MCGYWIIIVIAATTKSRALATVCMLTEHYDCIIGLYFGITAVQEKVFKIHNSWSIQLRTITLLQILVIDICFNIEFGGHMFWLGQVKGQIIK